jgi:hypothetical protein
MRSRDATIEDSYYVHDTPCLTEAAERIKEILDAKYEPANLDELTANCTHLTEEQQEQLNTLLKKYKTLFDGTLGYWKGEDYDIELRSDATPYHARPFPIPRIHEQTLRQEVERLCQIGVLKKSIAQNGQPQLLTFQKRMAPYNLFQIFGSSTNASNVNHIQYQKFKICY